MLFAEKQTPDAKDNDDDSLLLEPETKGDDDDIPPLEPWNTDDIPPLEQTFNSNRLLSWVSPDDDNITSVCAKLRLIPNKTLRQAAQDIARELQLPIFALAHYGKEIDTMSAALCAPFLEELVMVKSIPFMGNPENYDAWWERLLQKTFAEIIAKYMSIAKLVTNNHRRAAKYLYKLLEEARKETCQVIACDCK